MTIPVRGSDTRQCKRCLLLQPQDQFMGKQCGPVGNYVNICSDCVDRAFSEHFAPTTFGMYSAVEIDTDATMIQEDKDRPPCLGGGGASVANNIEKELHPCGAIHSALASSVASMNDYGHNDDENIQNYSSPSKRAIGSNRKGSPGSPLPLSPHKTSGHNLSLSNDHSHTKSTSSYCSLLLSSPTRAATTPAKKQCQGVYSGSKREVLIEVAKSMESNTQRLQSIATESEDPIT